MIRVTRSIALDDDELHFDFIRASGPGGQNVNKVASAAQLRFDVVGSPSLPDDVRERLIRLARRRVNRLGELVITARRYRRQDRNREDAIERLVELIRRAAVKPRVRKKTKPSAAARQRRLDAKRRRSETKRMRRPTRREE
jgi:ribosome-associated protein